MYQVIILHGSMGSPFENWIPSLSQRLIKDGVRVLAPQFPTPEGQNYNTWFDVLNTYKDYFDRNNTIVVTHSISAAFALKYLMQTQKHVKGFISVAGYYTLKKSEKTKIYQPLIQSFVQTVHPHHFAKYAKHRYQFLSNNDDFIAENDLHAFAESIDATKKFVPEAGHFNEATGYTEFDDLYYLITELLKKD